MGAGGVFTMKKTTLFTLCLAMASASVAYGASHSSTGRGDFVVSEELYNSVTTNPLMSQYVPIILANGTNVTIESPSHSVSIAPGQMETIWINREHRNNALPLLLVDKANNTEANYELVSRIGGFSSRDLILIKGTPQTGFDLYYRDGSSLNRGFNMNEYITHRQIKPNQYGDLLPF